MAAPVIELADALAAELATATGYTFERRIAPYTKRDLIVAGKWVIFSAGEDTEPAARKIDKSTLTVDVAYQRALPEATEAHPDPLENLPFLDDCMQIVDNVKACYRSGGSLRDAKVLDLKFVRMTNAPIYRADLLVDYSIFAAVIRLEYTGELGES